MTMQGYRDQCVRMATNGYFYDNSYRRSYPDPYKGRDCSTGAAYALIDSGYAGVNPGGTSFSFATDCWEAVRPPFLTEHFGPGQGTFIGYQQAMTVLSWGFRGSNSGRNEDSVGDGHIETIWGNGTKLSFGFHSHASGVGFDDNGIDNHHLEWFAIPPWFMGELQVLWGVEIDWAWLVHVAQWEADVRRSPLRYKQHGPMIQTLNDLLRMRGLVKRSGNRYGIDTRDGVVHLKTLHHAKNRSGKIVDGVAAGYLVRGK